MAIENADDIKEHALALTQWLENRGLTPVESVAVCGMFVSGALSTFQSDAMVEKFVEAVHTSYAQGKMFMATGINPNTPHGHA